MLCLTYWEWIGISMRKQSFAVEYTDSILLDDNAHAIQRELECLAIEVSRCGIPFASSKGKVVVQAC